MRTRLLYLAAALVGLCYSVSLAGAGLYGAPISFAWWSTVVLLGSALLAGCAALGPTSKRPWTRWPAVVGSGILTAYFIPAAVGTVRHYARGELIASLTQLGIRLALVVPVLFSMMIALWDIWDSDRRLKPEE
jgi:hypothetical protein